MDRCRMSFETIIDYYQERLDAAQMAEVRAHLATGCESCSTQIAWMQRALPALSADFQSAPESAQERVRQLYREQYAASNPARPPIIPWLVFDNRLSPALAGVRDSGADAQALYRTAQYDIDIWQEQDTPETWYLIGQALAREGGAATAPVSARLESPTGEARPADLDGSEFHISGIPGGTYTLRLTMPDGEIQIPELTFSGTAAQPSGNR